MEKELNQESEQKRRGWGTEKKIIIILSVLAVIALLLYFYVISPFLAYSYLSDFMEEAAVEKDFFNTTDVTVFCQDGIINMKNINIAAEDLVVKDVRDENGNTVGTMSVQENGNLTSNCGSSCASGKYLIFLGTISGIQAYAISC